MSKELTALTKKVTTLTRANAKLKTDFEALKLDLESQKPMTGEAATSKVDMRLARQHFEAGNMAKAMECMLGMD